MTEDAPLVEVTHLTKVFTRELRRSLLYAATDITRELLARPARDRRRHLRPGEFKAVDDLSLHVDRGEAVAVMGDNGAGKSTLLKLIYGLIKPDGGEIRIRGRLGALIELGTGFDPVLSGRENIAINGAIMGIGDRRLRELTEEIVAFAELEDAIDSPVRYYSSGMIARLAFAVAAHLEPDVLIVDEVLAVGDLGFQRRCASYILQYLDRGGALVFVSHNPHQVLSLCTRGVLLEAGREVASGSAVEVLSEYYSRRDEIPQESLARVVEIDEEHRVVIDELVLSPQDLRTGAPLELELRYRSAEPLDAIWGITFHSADGWITIAGNYDMRSRRLEPQGAFRAIIPRLPLVRGRYYVRAVIADARSLQALALIGHQDDSVPLRVEADPDDVLAAGLADHAMVTVDVEWS